MRKSTRQFTVEVRSSNRRSYNKPTSIWGNIDLKALAREAEEEISNDQSPGPLQAAPVEERVMTAPDLSPAAMSDDILPLVPDATETDVLSEAIEEKTDAGLTAPDVVVVVERRKAPVGRIRKAKRPQGSQDKTGSLPLVALVEQSDLEWLTAENHRLKLLLRQKLLHDNAVLRGMLSRQ